jgi:hypothetical protein
VTGHRHGPAPGRRTVERQPRRTNAAHRPKLRRPPAIQALLLFDRTGERPGSRSHRSRLVHSVPSGHLRRVRGASRPFLWAQRSQAAVLCLGDKTLPRNGAGQDPELDSKRRAPPPTRAGEHPAGGQPRGSRETSKWRGPESSRRHHDFQAAPTGHRGAGNRMTTRSSPAPASPSYLRIRVLPGGLGLRGPREWVPSLEHPAAG